MKIIITDYFEELLKKGFKDINISFLVDKIKVESKNFIGFKEPFFKVKINSNNKTYRLIVNYEKDLLKILFINIFDKKDKKIGENITRILHKDIILKSYEKNLLDIEKGKYKIYEI